MFILFSGFQVLAIAPAGTLVSGTYSFSSDATANTVYTPGFLWKATTPNINGMRAYDGELFVNEGSTNTSQQSITISTSAGTTPSTFVLQNISFGELAATSTFSGNITITGNNPSGTNPVVSFSNSELPNDFSKPNYYLRDLTATAFATVKIESFTISYSSNSAPWDFGIASFAVSTAPLGVLLATSPTLSFSDDSGFSDSKAVDGEGGSVTITDVNIESYPINSAGAALSVDPLEYHDGTDWAGYQAIITYGGTLKHYGWAVKSASGSNFSLQSLDFMDWGGWDGAKFVIEAFDNGSSLDTVWFSGNTNSSYVHLDLGGVLSANFGNVDEIRFYRQDGTDSWTALNNIEVSSPVVASLSISATVDNNASCNGGSDGGITASPSGGTSPYTYSWSNAASTATISGVVAGTYTVTVTDVSSNTATASATVTQPTALVASASVNSTINCNGGSDGQVTASATGGISPYTYAWNTGGTNALETGLSAGTYYVTITDNNGCYDFTSVTLTEPTPLIASASVRATIDCNGGNDGGLTSSATGGIIPYTYSWSNGGTTASQTGMSAGTYTVTITDSNGCTSTSSKTLTSPAVLHAGQIY